ncbi:MAG TPA: SpoIID/LytB domain-containing protein [candidate division Zixibacteria bacterium]|nr:SpoIID/LytB domain-containing protein [candidate division Zixibacteria bacterium]
MKKLLVFTSVSALLYLAGCGKPPRIEEKPTPEVAEFVKVRLPVTGDRFEVRGDGGFIFQLHRADSSEEWFETDSYFQFGRGKPFFWLKEGGQINFDSNVVWALMRPKKEGRQLLLDGKGYRGEFWATLDTFANVIVVNKLLLEDYIKGVLPPEIGKRPAKEKEVLKAQAVAARTYTLSHLGQYPGKPWDMEADSRDQVYTGVDAEDPICSQAVEETAGEAATFNGKFINAYYHSTCGGKTDYISSVWPHKPQEEYLVPADDDTFCLWSKNFYWREGLSQGWLVDKISAFLKQHGRPELDKIAPVTDMSVTERNSSGRVRILTVNTETESYSLVADSIRWALGRPSSPSPQAILPSTLFDVETFRSRSEALDSAVVTGRGAGHGIGMCQTGAIGRARAGQGYREILEHYYSGIRLERVRRFGSR